MMSRVLRPSKRLDYHSRAFGRDERFDVIKGVSSPLAAETYRFAYGHVIGSFTPHHVRHFSRSQFFRETIWTLAPCAELKWYY